MSRLCFPQTCSYVPITKYCALCQTFLLSVPLTNNNPSSSLDWWIQIHQSAYRDRCQLKTPTLPRTGFFNGRHTLIDGFGSTHILQMPLVENFATIMSRKLVLQLQDRFSRESLEELSSHSAQAWRHILQVDRELVFSRKEIKWFGVSSTLKGTRSYAGGQLLPALSPSLAPRSNIHLTKWRFQQHGVVKKKKKA